MTLDPELQQHPSGLIIVGHQSELGAAEIRRRFRAGFLVRVRKGMYIRKANWTRSQLYRLRATAAGLAHADAVVTGPGAAALQRISHLYPDDMVIDVFTPRGHGSRTSGFVHLIHGHAVEDTVDVDSVRATPPAKTAIETALLHGSRDGLVVAESALWNGRSTIADLERELAKTENRKGRMAARFVVDVASDRSQSPGESLTSWCIRQAKLPEPLQQVEIVDEKGNFVAKVDFFWPETGMIVEFDGDVKTSGIYGEPFEIARAQLARDAALTNLGMRILHVKWAEVFSGSGIKTIREFYEHFAKLGGGYLGGWRLADLKR